MKISETMKRDAEIAAEQSNFPFTLGTDKSNFLST